MVTHLHVAARPGARDIVDCEVPVDFAALAAVRKADFMIDMIAPRYVNYYALWLDYAVLRPEAVLVLRFPELCANPVDALARVLSIPA